MTSDPSFSGVSTAALKLPLESKLKLVTELLVDLYMNPALSIQKGAFEPALEFCRGIVVSAAKTQLSVIDPERICNLAGQLLRNSSKAFSGPDRVLAAAARLHFKNQHKPSTARMINTENDSFRGNYIANITTAIGSAVKEGYLNQVEGDGHGKFLVTESGFAHLNGLFYKIPPKVEELPEDDNFEDVG